jgi:hypothetical protein
MEASEESLRATEWLGSSSIAKVVTDHWVKDLHATVRRFSADYNLGPWKISELRAPLVRDVEFRGAPGHIEWLAAMTEVGPLAVEVLEVVGGSDAVLEWTDQLPDGYWHFVSYHRELADAEEAQSNLRACGFPLVLSGRVGGTGFYMFETGKLFDRMFEVAGGDLSAVEWEGFES